jgi:ubiquinone/menaquinone biosynthesis C-methylase UbiE
MLLLDLARLIAARSNISKIKIMDKLMTSMRVARRVKPYKGMAMEGRIAAWYAKNTGRSMDEFRRAAARIAARLAAGASVLEIAPGPGYLAIELAKLGRFTVSGLDISESFVRIATENAAKAGVAIQFRHGDAAHQPFADDSFDFIACRAAFKNFGDPIGALREMYRVLKPGGTALVIDMRNNVTNGAINEEVRKLHLTGMDALFTRVALRFRKRAYSAAAFREMIGDTPFGTAEILEVPIGVEVTLVKRLA